MKRVASRSGFTLVELMISTGISLLLVLGLVSTYTQQRRSYKVIQQINEMDQNLRTSVDMMIRAMRNAGYGIDAYPSQVASWFTWASGMTNYAVVTQGSGSNPDTLRLLGAFEPALATTTVATAVGATTLTVGSGQASKFNTTSNNIIYIGQQETAKITGISGNVLTITRSPTVSGVGLRYAYAAGTGIELVRLYTYKIVNDPYTYPSIAHLQREDSAGSFSYAWQKMIANGIEDLQFTMTSSSIKASVRARTTKIDHTYLHPTYGDRYRRQTASFDAKVRRPSKTY